MAEYTQVIHRKLSRTVETIFLNVHELMMSIQPLSDPTTSAWKQTLSAMNQVELIIQTINQSQIRIRSFYQGTSAC